MTAQKPEMPADLTALAAEACDLWQEHLASTAADPKAKAELMRLMEPSRRLFAEWAAMMQHGAHGANPFSPAKYPSPAGPASAAASSDHEPHGLAQLADRLAALEKRLARLEAGSRGTPSAPAGTRKRPKS